jgi:DNA repair protein RadC
MKQSEFVAEIQLKYIPSDIKTCDYGKIKTSKDAYHFIYSLYDPDTIGLKETFVVIFLNRASNIIGYNIHSSGGIDGTVMDIRLIIATALKCAATSIIIAHNHPSGNLDPSEQDRKSTKNLNQALELFNISLLDHLIITPKEKAYFSLTDKDEM